MTKSGVCAKCGRKSKDLIWSDAMTNFICWKCSNKITKDLREMQGKA